MKKANKKVEGRLAARQKDAAEKKAVAAAKRENAKKEKERAASPTGETSAERAMQETDKPPRPSLLTLAAESLKVNAQADGCNCQAMVEYALAQGWQTSGKTPAATLSSAILTEIKKKGADSRFVKTGRGLFKHA